MPTLDCASAGIYGRVVSVSETEDAHFLQHF
jgi:hypothetical protein